MRKNAPKCTFLTILDILTSAHFGGIYIMYTLFATSTSPNKHNHHVTLINNFFFVEGSYQYQHMFWKPHDACVNFYHV